MQTRSLGSAATCLKSSWRDGFYSHRFMSWCSSMWHWELIRWDVRPSFNLLSDRNMVLSHNSKHRSHTSGNLDGSLKNQACSGGNASGPLVSDLRRKQIRSIHCNLVTFFFFRRKAWSCCCPQVVMKHSVKPLILTVTWLKCKAVWFGITFWLKQTSVLTL